MNHILLEHKNNISTKNNKNDICQKHNWQFSSLKKVLTLECLILPHFHFRLMRKQQHLNTPQQDGCWIVLDVLIASCIYLWFHCFYFAVVITNIKCPLPIQTCESLSNILNVRFHFSTLFKAQHVLSLLEAFAERPHCNKSINIYLFYILLISQFTAIAYTCQSVAETCCGSEFF